MIIILIDLWFIRYDFTRINIIFLYGSFNLSFDLMILLGYERTNISGGENLSYVPKQTLKNEYGMT
jgi:hypothetical protein